MKVEYQLLFLIIPGITITGLWLYLRQRIPKIIKIKKSTKSNITTQEKPHYDELITSLYKIQSIFESAIFVTQQQEIMNESYKRQFLKNKRKMNEKLRYEYNKQSNNSSEIIKNAEDRLSKINISGLNCNAKRVLKNIKKYEIKLKSLEISHELPQKDLLKIRKKLIDQRNFINSFLFSIKK